ncbi:nitrous oxide reductase family maturation protein NosD [Zoogloeaceae bacterium G21618-S1]|nr:nitrous oxide reductase family maturation protein NosD [Zoogloeaceae bacterium G21618-S1]
MLLTLRFAFFAALLGLLPPATASATPLQPLIDAAQASTGILRLAPGTYEGPVKITGRLILDGGGKAIIQGDHRSSVITLLGSDSVLRGLIVRGSGDSHDQIHSGIYIEGNNNRIEDNMLDDVLFGIVLQKANHNLVRGNLVRSRGEDTADRGDGLRLWYAMDNRIEDNVFEHMRDLTFSNSPRNRIIGNTIRDSRRAMNFLFSTRTLVEANLATDNATGIVVINSNGFILRNNRVMHAMHVSGAGIAIKESTAVLIEGNELIHCAVGLMADSSSDPLSRLVLVNNRLAHNVTGINFYGERGGRILINNRFEHNLWQVTATNAGDVTAEHWAGNYWDTYQGFDLDQDGVGDQPHELYVFADRIWMETPEASFFRNSPLMEMIDFLERLAPFSNPALVLRDPSPAMRAAPWAPSVSFNRPAGQIGAAPDSAAVNAH